MVLKYDMQVTPGKCLDLRSTRVNAFYLVGV